MQHLFFVALININTNQRKYGKIFGMFSDIDFYTWL